jgi:hypothetical protein
MSHKELKNRIRTHHPKWLVDSEEIGWDDVKFELEMAD